MSISAYIGEQEWHMLRSKIVESWSDYFYSSNSWKECYTWHRRHARDALTATTCCSVAHGTELQEGRWFRNDKAWWTTSSGLWGEPWRLDEGIAHLHATCFQQYGHARTHDVFLLRLNSYGEEAHSAMPDGQKWSDLLRIAQDEVVRNGQMYSDS